MEPEIWLRPHGEDHYEHIDVCVVDLLIASKDPKNMTDVLTNINYFKLKGAGPISYHLGCVCGRNDDGALHFSLKKNVQTMVDCYYNMFDTKPKISF